MGLVPKKAIVEAGKHFLRKQQRSLGIPEHEIIRIAVKSMGLDELKPFRPEEKIIEYMLEAGGEQSALLTDMSLTAFAEETASESPAPGGGSVSAYLGALGAALGTMVANLSAHKAGWDDRWEEFSDIAEDGQALVRRLLHLVDEDTAAFNRIKAAIGMPKGTDDERRAREEAMEAATVYACEVPLQTMTAALDCFGVLALTAQKGLKASASDVGVGALAARAAVRGAGLNVRINAAGLADRTKADALVARARELEELALQKENEILAIIAL